MHRLLPLSRRATPADLGDRPAGVTPSTMGYPTHMTRDDPTDEQTPNDPRLDEPEGDDGMPGELIDGDANLPGDQPVEDDPPTVSEVYDRD